MGTNGTNGAATPAAPAADQLGDLFPTFPRVELETYVQTEEGYIFRAVFRDTSLAEAVAALQRKGCTPAAPVARSAPAGGNGGNDRPKGKSQRVAPWYNDQGEACCPTHRRPLKDGQWGLYCSSKTEEGYCRLKFAE